MRLIIILLTSFSVQFGLVFAPVQSNLIRFIGLLLLLNQLLLEVYYSYKRIAESASFIDWIGYESYYISCLLYGFVMLTKGKLIVENILLNINLLNKFQYRVACSLIIFFMSLYVINFFIFFSYTFVNSKYFSFSIKRFESIFFIISIPYIHWKFFSGILYALMYFCMHLKHMKLLDHIKQKKSHSHVLVFNVLSEIQFDYENFDNLVSIFPALWMTSLFLGINANINFVKKYGITITLITGFITNEICWYLVYILVNVCKSTFSKKVKCIQYHIVINESMNDEKLLKLRFFDQMAENHVTAFHLLKFDKGLFLPYIGSLLSYTFLFYDKFSGKTC